MRRLARELTVGRVALLLPLTAVVIGARMPIRDNSFLWHIRAGTVQLESGVVLTADPFSFTAHGEAWRTQSWLLELLYGWLEPLGPHVLGALIVGATAALLLGAVALRSYSATPSPLVAATVTLMVMWVSLGWFSPRPVVVSMSLFALLVVAADHSRLRWAAPLLIWIWAAVHGGFVVGLGYLTLDFLRRPTRKRLVNLVASVLLASLTAHGLGVWQVLFEFLGSSTALDTIIEWAVPDFFGLALLPFLGVIIALIIAARRGALTRTDQWVAFPFLLFAFSASRAVPLSAIALAPWIAASFEPVATKLKSTHGNYVTMGIAVAALAIPLLLPIEGGIDETSFPIEAVAALTEPRVFHEDGTGGYLIFSQYPDRLVYIDDRAELYGDIFVEFGEIRSAKRDWREHFDRWDIQQALVRVEAPIVRLLAEAGWIPAYEDEQFIVLNAPGLAEA